MMVHHFQDVFPGYNRLLILIKAVFDYGWVGVDLFFALSGFLITGILLDTRLASNYFRAFYARRVLRIFPLYYSVLIVILAVASRLKPRPAWLPLVADEKLYFCYLTNWLVLWKGKWGGNILGHFWSLAVEEQFYLVWPLCVWLLVRSRLRGVAVGASVIALLTRTYWVVHAGPSQSVVMATVTRMDSLLCGALGALVIRDTMTMAVVKKKLPFIAVVAILVFVLGVVSPSIQNGEGPLFFVETFGFSLLAVGFSALVLFAASTDGDRSPLQRALRNRVLTDFGKYSYGIYVYHVPLFTVGNVLINLYLLTAVKANPLLFGVSYFIFLFATSFFVAKLSYECFERYFLGLKRYFEPCESKAAASAASLGAD